MSELIAEARVLVTPDTTAFRSLLLAQLTAIDKTIPPVPVQIAPVLTGTGATAAAATAAREVAAAEATTASAIRGATDARRAAIASTESYTRRLNGLSSGAASAGLSLVGLRGATLAASGPFLVGAAAAISFGKAIQIATSFEQEIAVFAATTGATATQMERVSAAARELGADISLPGVTAAQAAQTMAEFAKAGLEVEDAIAATRGGLQLAQAAQLSYTDAVTLSANALNAFNLEGDQAVRVADTLANAANLAQGGIADTALALRQAAGAAAVVGVSFEDTTALLTLLAKNGLTGSDAGTALRTAFLRLVNPSEEAKKILADLNVQLRDINGNVRPEVFADFAAAQRDLSAAAQQANAAIVFGQDAFRAFGFLGREGARGLAEVREGLQQTGTASRIANARMVGLTGATANLSNQLSTLGQSIGETLTPALEVLVDTAASGVSELNDLIGVVKELESALDDLPGSESGQDKVAGFLKNAISDPITFFAPIARLAKEESDDVEDALDEGANKVKAGGEKVRQAIVDAANKGLQATFGFSKIAPAIEQQMASASAALTLDLTIAQAQGNEGLELSLLREREARQEAFLDAVLRRTQTPKTVALATKAAQNLDTTRAQIAQIISGQQAEAKAAADKIVAAAAAADRAFLEGLQRARTGQQNAVAAAANTESVQDDLAQNIRLRALVRRQIEAIRESSVDERDKAAAIQALTSVVIATTGEIRRLRQAEQEQREANRQAIFDRTAENADLRIQIAEARGNKDAVIQLLDVRIRLAQQAVVRAKKAKEGVLRAILQVEELKRKRRELLKELQDDDQGGTTAFSLLTEAAQRFTGGNIINANQPFAGPTEFTADLSQFLRRSSTTTTTGTSVAVQQNFQGFQGGVDRLVEALNANTAALNGGEGGPTKRTGVRAPVSGAIDRNDRRWRDSAQARETIEGAG